METTITPTVLFKPSAAVEHKPLLNCHEGKGSVDWRNVLDGSDLKGRKLNYFHDDILAPGASIGYHAHSGDEEYYYFLSGSGTMTLDDRTYPVSAGDVTAVYPGGKHGLENNGPTDIHFIVASVKQ